MLQKLNAANVGLIIAGVLAVACAVMLVRGMPIPDWVKALVLGIVLPSPWQRPQAQADAPKEDPK